MRGVRTLMQSLFLSLFVCLAALGRVNGLVKGPFLDLRTFVTKYKPTTALGDSSSSSVFAGVRFDEPIASSLKSLNIHEPSPIQEQAILALSTGLSCIIHAETGSGKTLCYLLPLLKRLMDEKKKNDNDNDNSKIMSIIVVPSKELAVQVAADVASMMGQSDDIDTRLVHLCLESGRAGLDGIRAPIVIGTPYKLLDAVRATQSVQSLDSVNYLVLDEVDRMLHALSKYSSNDVRRKERQIANPVKELIGDLARIRGFVPPDKNGGNSNSPLQVVAASATIGRPVRRELYHALMVGGGQRSASSSGELPLLRAKAAAAAAAAAVQVADDRETTTKRAVSVPRSIRHIALLRNDQSDSLTNKVATAKTMWTNGAMKGAQKALLFVPTSGDVQQVVGMLGFMGHAGEVVDLQQQLGITTNRDDNNASAGGVRGKQAVYKARVGTKEMVKRAAQSKLGVLSQLEVVGEGRGSSLSSSSLSNEEGENDGSGERERELFVIPLSGTRGLHIRDVEFVVMTAPPRTMDEYLHVAGRTGRAGNTVEGGTVITLATYDELKRLRSWETPLGITFDVMNE